MKKKVLAVILVAMTLLVGCGQSEEVSSPIVDVTPQPIATEAPVATEEPVEEAKELVLIKEREVVDGKMQSYLTGEWMDAEIAQRRNMAVMMPNNEPAIPHYGISQASIIYEAPAEKESCTRLMALYEEYDDLDRIGPVRSSRDYFVYEAMAYDSIYVNWGLAVPYVAPIFNEGRIDNVSQAVSDQAHAYSAAFGRVDRPGKATEFTGYLLVDKFDDGVKHFKYETEYTDRFVQAFTFADAEKGVRAEYTDSPDAVTIYPGGKGDKAEGGYQEAESYFVYDEKDQLYYRYQHGGPMIDEYNGEKIAVSNIVIKVCYGEWRDEKGYLAFRIHGVRGNQALPAGDAYVFTNGKVIKGVWERTGDYNPNMYYDEDGNEIILNQGKTWVCCVMDKYLDNITWEK